MLFLVIPKANLDDRTFDDIVAEAIRLIPRYCPEWTNHNPSDPGMTLIDLFAWMTELTIFRLNQVPEKTYLSLLELMGLSLIPPQSARAVVQFTPVTGARRSILVRTGTQIAADSAVSDTTDGGDEPVMFETERDALITNTALAACFNRSGERYTEYWREGALQPFTLFEARGVVEHILYLASPAFAYLAGEHTIQISFTAEAPILSVYDELINFLSWEYWDGRTWTRLTPTLTIAGRRKQNNTLYVNGPLAIEPCVVMENDDEAAAYYLRAVLVEAPEKRGVLRIKDITIETHFGGLGFMPDACLMNAGSQYQALDMNSVFRIFSENPAYNEMCYIASDEALSHAGNLVTVLFTFSEVYVPGGENESASFAYEYWDGNEWRSLREQRLAFFDGTAAFKQSGAVRFIVPTNLSKTTINNEEHCWIRVRLVTKDLAIGGRYITDEQGNWVWRFASKVHSPVFSAIRMMYKAESLPPERVIQDSNFVWRDLSADLTTAREEDSAMSVFDITQDTAPTLYLGFTAPFAAEQAALYIRIDEEHSPRSRAAALDTFFSDGPLAESPQRRSLNIDWEYWNGAAWANLPVNDYTDSFHESGFVEFDPPVNMSAKQELAKELYWLRARFVSGAFESQPKILAILTNAVYARNQTRHVNEIAGSGTGAPLQSVSPARGPLLPGVALFVDEGSIPPGNELAAMGKEGVSEPYLIEGDRVWVRYTEKTNFYASGPSSRHFVVDYRARRILFGDGERGINPPRRKFNIRLAEYHTGGGFVGNVAAGTLQILARSIPFIAACDNPFPAEGGADMEDVEALKSRAAGVFKSLHRAVTAEDFQWLSREASASVGRAACLKDLNRQGEIVIIIVPVKAAADDLRRKLVPSRELIRRVTAYLDERKLVGTRIRVQGPVYRAFRLSLSLLFRSEVLDDERLKKEIDASVRAAFHALTGGNGAGWEFGKTVTAGVVFKQLERISGLFWIDHVRITDLDAGVDVGSLILRPDELPYLDEIQIDTRRAPV